MNSSVKACVVKLFKSSFVQLQVYSALLKYHGDEVVKLDLTLHVLLAILLNLSILTFTNWSHSILL